MEKVQGVPIPVEGTSEFERLNSMAKKAIILLLVVFTLNVLEQQAFGMIFTNIGSDLGQAELAPLITSLPGIVLGIVCVIYGALGDFVSLKRMTIFGMILFLGGSLFGVLFGTFDIWFVIIARILQAAGGQVSGSVFLVLVSKYIKKENRVIYYSIFVAIFRFSAALGILLAGYVALINWVFLFGLPLILILFVPSLLKNLPDDHVKGAQVDWIGFILIGAFAGAITMYFTNMNITWIYLSIV
ncbi:MAG: MFS transporter, partial [Bacilli bacterium]